MAPVRGNGIRCPSSTSDGEPPSRGAGSVLGNPAGCSSAQAGAAKREDDLQDTGTISRPRTATAAGGKTPPEG